VTKLFIFDVGGVLVELRPERRREILYARRAPEALPPAERAELAEVGRGYRLGLTDEATYVEAVTRLLDVTLEELERAEAAFIVAGDPRMRALVGTLRRDHRVICLSNTQPMHWRHVIANLLGPGFFDREYVTHELGVEKPDPAIYRLVAEREGFAARDVVFVDDTPENLPPARALGWGTVIHHTSVAATLARIDAALAR
jgi:putative hydrolase of the HAD superfamily